MNYKNKEVYHMSNVMLPKIVKLDENIICQCNECNCKKLVDILLGRICVFCLHRWHKSQKIPNKESVE